jgi:hypothetical protein
MVNFIRYIIYQTILVIVIDTINIVIFCVLHNANIDILYLFELIKKNNKYLMIF